jgi:hypothetical protein
MTKFRTWLSSTWNILKNVDSKVGAFIGKAAPIIRTVGNAMSYLPGKIGEIGKAINYYGGMVDSYTGLLPNGQLKDKMISYTGNVNQVYLQQLNPMKYEALTSSYINQK